MKYGALGFSHRLQFTQHFLAVLVGSICLIGCGSDRVATRNSDPAEKNGVSQSDTIGIKEAALRRLFDKFASTNDNVSAYVIENDESASLLVKMFTGYRLIVTNAVQISTDRGMALNKETGKPVLLWSVKLREVGRDKATAYVEWYSGSMAAGGYTLKLIHRNGKWIVQSEHMDWIS